MTYIGRFAPSPTGPLHFGSLVAAVGSYLQARAQNGRWLLRIEDIDRPREVPGAAERIVDTLAAFGFEWDGPIERQSRHLKRYDAALAQLTAAGVVFDCMCSRAQIAAQAADIDSDELRYPGTCRHRVLHSQPRGAVRLRVESGAIRFVDRLQGPITQDVAAACGDFVVKRRDGLYSYHLAVVVDDAAQGVTEVVRGADLLDSTPRQILLQRALGLSTPDYCHVPLAVDSDGRKLSKSTQSIPIDAEHATHTLWQALAFLQQAPPLELQNVAPTELWAWAREHWRLTPLQDVRHCPAPAATPYIS